MTFPVLIRNRSDTTHTGIRVCAYIYTQEVRCGFTLPNSLQVQHEWSFPHCWGKQSILSQDNFVWRQTSPHALTHKTVCCTSRSDAYLLSRREGAPRSFWMVPALRNTNPSRLGHSSCETMHCCRMPTGWFKTTSSCEEKKARKTGASDVTGRG